MSSAPIEVCCLYASDDEPLRRALEKHVSAMRREGLISLWHDRQVAPGHDRIEAMDVHLDSAAVILLLVSSDFLDSDECYEGALQRALERHSRNEVKVVPILVRSVDYQGTAFARLTALPTGARPITLWDDQDEAWLDVANGLRKVIGTIQSPGSFRLRAPSTQIITANREAMLVKLQRLYQDLLADSLRETAWIELGLIEQPGAVQNTRNLILRQATLPERSLSPGTSILQVYQQANQELLILGVPGSGKSTLLYQLGHDLTNEATRVSTVPLPILFPLSSWANSRLPLEKWMVEQLTSVLYRVPRKQSEQWVQQEQIVPLLDGLDEMDEAVRPACIGAINAYQREHPLHPLVVCCRREEYTMATSSGQGDGRLLLQNAVEVQLLSGEQLDATLRSAGKPFAALRSELRQNPKLHDLARTPLWLNVLLLAFKDTPVHALSRQRSVLHQKVFASYVQRQIEERGDYERYSLKQTKRWLSWLAGQMRVQNQTTFAVELLQPSWLAKRPRLCYRWSVGLSVGLSFMLIFGLIFGSIVESSPVRIFWSIFGLIVGLIVGLVGGRENRITLVEAFTWSWKKSRSRLNFGLSVGLSFGLSIGLSIALIFISSVGLIRGLLFFGLTFGLSFGLGFMLIVGLVGGFQPTQYIERDTLSPGDGLRRSLRNGLILGLSFWLTFGLIVELGAVQSFKMIMALSVWLSYEPSLGLITGLFYGLIGGLSSGLNLGLLAVLQHYTLRFWLWHTGAFPFQIIDFLEDARARHLLKRVGGSYQFMHRHLLDYFAGLEHEPPAPTDH